MQRVQYLSLQVIEWGELSVATTECLKRTFAKMKDANLTKVSTVDYEHGSRKVNFPQPDR